MGSAKREKIGLTSDCICLLIVGSVEIEEVRFAPGCAFPHPTLCARTNCWTLENPMASLSTCHPGIIALDGNFVKSDYKHQLRITLQCFSRKTLLTT